MKSVGRVKWKRASGVLCNHNILIKLKDKSYQTVIGAVMLYDCDCLTTLGKTE
uniref:Uncharacterized protein n=1 Tax=Rhizophora mucronata TaxID=61149 RepID=A0A2P2QWP5_RHIMU